MIFKSRSQETAHNKAREYYKRNAGRYSRWNVEEITSLLENEKLVYVPVLLAHECFNTSAREDSKINDTL